MKLEIKIKKQRTASYLKQPYNALMILHVYGV